MKKIKKKKSKKFVVGVVLIVIGVIGLLGVFTGTEDVGSLIGGSLAFIAVGVLLLILDKKFPAKAKTAAVKKPSVPDGQINYKLFDDIMGDSVLMSQYENDIAMLDSGTIAGKGGKKLDFVPEPTNEYDDKAVMIMLDGNKIGYVYRRGNIQSMIHDYIRKGWTFYGYLNKYSIAENKATYKIGFYVPLSRFESKKFKLTKTKGKEDALNECTLYGDDLTVEFDDETESYVVSNAIANDIGVLPKSAHEWIEENGYDRIVGILDSDQSDGLKATIYLISR
ncbi:MAG: HIRAN domain-containing protein [Oscillospiraceae bacterium]|nr:HIRAN domain-containing protein [Oscillospiraceae bacterium]